MKKLTGEFRLRRMLVIGIAIGLVAGVLCTGVAAKSVLSKNKAEFAAEKEKLKKKTNELKEEIMKHEAANNSAEALGSDKEGWALVLVNDSHPLDVSYVPESMVELESERFVDARIEMISFELIELTSLTSVLIFVLICPDGLSCSCHTHRFLPAE